MPYQITEPHPTAQTNTYIHTGRGGAGNMFKVKPSSTLAKTSSPLAKLSNTQPSSSSKASRVSTGRGGVANIRESAEIRHFTFDEELALQSGREAHTDVWHVGRGGAGNWGSKKPSSARKLSNESGSTAESTRSGFLGRLSEAFSRE